MEAESGYRTPVKLLSADSDLFQFRISFAYNRLLRFIQTLDESVRGKSLKEDVYISPNTEKVLGILESINSIIDQTPPLEQPNRFANKAFASFVEKLKTSAVELVSPLVADLENGVPVSEAEGAPVSAAQEIAVYLANSFGDQQRLDYGTGHEANFVCFLCCLAHLNVFTPEDHPALVLRVFWRYLSLMRRLQTLYLLEPAGSRGVWGLDDFHFLPFLWGASQLIGHPHMKPKSARYKETVDLFADHYLYLSAIQFINQIKTVSLAEHSPLLNDITVVPTWVKVNSGLMKMYKVEVLHKFAVVQHFLFGSILSLSPDPSADVELARQEEAHRASCHATTKDFPCCSNAVRLPSALAVSAGAPTLPVFPGSSVAGGPGVRPPAGLPPEPVPVRPGVFNI
eukprot:GILI01019282.1.p1 GENE.GILI01019282.1~~GILI01019282.1.p1  ORF type:complete len:398 (+),score=73.97 GILI01019282.1:40-1233(+)